MQRQRTLVIQENPAFQTGVLNCACHSYSNQYKGRNHNTLCISISSPGYHSHDKNHKLCSDARQLQNGLYTDWLWVWCMIQCAYLTLEHKQKGKLESTTHKWDRCHTLVGRVSPLCHICSCTCCQHPIALIPLWMPHGSRRVCQLLSLQQLCQRVLPLHLDCPISSPVHEQLSHLASRPTPLTSHLDWFQRMVQTYLKLVPRS